MGAIGECCCCPCGTALVGSRSIKFKTDGGTHDLVEQTIAANFVASSVCCSKSDNTINVLKGGGTFTNRYDITDKAVMKKWLCFPDLSFLLQVDADSDVRRSGASAYRIDLRYCRVVVDICLESMVIYGVPTCGTRVTVTVSNQHAIDSKANSFNAIKSDVSQYYPTVSSVSQWIDCNTSATITAWPSTPAMPSVSPTVPACGIPDCSVKRSVFLAGVTSLPTGTVVTLRQADTIEQACLGAIVFNPCPVDTSLVWLSVTDACGKQSYDFSGGGLGFLVTNFGAVCVGDDTAGGCPTFIQPDLISRTRTQSQTLSHSLGTKIYDPYAADWTLTL